MRDLRKRGGVLRACRPAMGFLLLTALGVTLLTGCAEPYAARPAPVDPIALAIAASEAAPASEAAAPMTPVDGPVVETGPAAASSPATGDSVPEPSATDQCPSEAPPQTTVENRATEVQLPGYESVATYYANFFNGRPTITDEIYDPEKMTAATHEVPLGTWVKVVNPKNGKEVVVRVNDRPRKRKFPLIDLSRAAARQLGFLGQGKIKVRVIPLPPDTPLPLSGNPPVAAPQPSLAPRPVDG